MDGAAHREAAERAGVSRETVSRWVGRRGPLRPALAAWQRDLAAEHVSTVAVIRSLSLAVVLAGLRGGETTTAEALTILKTVGVAPNAPDEVMSERQPPDLREQVAASIEAMTDRLEANLHGDEPPG